MCLSVNKHKNVPVVNIATKSKGAGETHVRERISWHYFISARNIVYADVPACTNHGTVAEGGTNAYPGRAVERHENASPCTAPESRYASGSAVDRSAQVKERAAEGNAYAGASPVA